MANGGARPGAGRKPGGRNKITQEAIAKASDGLSPLDYLLGVLRDTEEEPARRMDAAKAAAPYCHARLATVDHKSSDGSMRPVAPTILAKLSSDALAEIVSAADEASKD
jgi:hypothetical protein